MAYKLFSDALTSEAMSYSGHAEKCSVIFSTGPEQTSFVDNWLKNSLISRAKAEVRNHGGAVLRVTTYRDASPTWTTKWRCEITAAFPTGYAAEVGVLVAGPWAIIIAAIFVAIVAYFVVKPVIEAITNLIWGPGDRDLGDVLANPWIWLVGGVAIVMLLSGRKKANTS